MVNSVQGDDCRRREVVWVETPGWCEEKDGGGRRVDGGQFVGKLNPRQSSVPPVGEWATNDDALSLVVVWLLGKRQGIRR